MSRKLDLAGAFALGATMAFTLMSADGAGAAVSAESPRIASEIAEAAAETQATGRMVAPRIASEAPAVAADDDSLETSDDTAPSAVTLAGLVAEQPLASPLSREMNCLAGAIYFEARSEPLLGQLAVGRVIVSRARSGRFPDSYCGVVYQPSQFSFVRGNAMPSVNTESRGWKNAVAIARIAHEGVWRSPVEGALFFHASQVSPRWQLDRMARVGNHIFYR